MKKFWIDYLRVLAIFAVIVIHVSEIYYVRFNEVDGFVWWISNFLNAVSRFAVPLFVMISGAVLLGKDVTLFEFYKKRFKRLAPPIIFWTFFYLLYDLCNDKNLEYLIWDLKIGLFANGHGAVHLWYLTMYACLMVFVPYINMLINGAKPSQKDFGVFMVLMFLFFSLNTISILVNTFQGIEITWFKKYYWFIAYLIGGYYIDRYGETINIKSSVIVGMISVFVVFGAFMNYYFVSTFGIMEDFYFLRSTGPVIFVITLLIFLLARNNASVLQRNKLIESISGTSFGIYLIHPFFISLIRKIFPDHNINPIIYMAIMILVVSIISHFSMLLIKKIKFIRNVC